MEGVNDHHGEINSKKKRKIKKQHKKHDVKRVGNFKRYYTYRLGQTKDHSNASVQSMVAESDPRLSILQNEWFEGKEGLDVGCNSGDLTLAIAKRFAPSYVMGIDVDPELISHARAQLRDVMHQKRIESAFTSVISKDKTSDREASTVTDKDDVFTKEMPVSFRFWKAPVASEPPSSETKPSLSTDDSSTKAFPFNVVFKREDFVSDAHGRNEYDFITCFSVTKWIHLFHGDDGIKATFAKCFDLLRPNGRLILEPQPWKSYHKRKFTSDVTAANYDRIALRPKDFAEYLVKEVGFKSCTLLQVCQTQDQGFRRPVYVIEK